MTPDEMFAIHNAFRREHGAYEVRIEGDRRLVSGECAAGDGAVREDEASVVRFHPTERGGLFHARCEPPASAGWYSLDDGEGAEDL